MEIWKKLKRKIEYRPEYVTVEGDRAIEDATDGKYSSLAELAKEVARLEEIVRERNQE
jgi:hypothetical protein